MTSSDRLMWQQAAVNSDSLWPDSGQLCWHSGGIDAEVGFIRQFFFSNFSTIYPQIFSQFFPQFIHNFVPLFSSIIPQFCSNFFTNIFTMNFGIIELLIYIVLTYNNTIPKSVKLTDLVTVNWGLVKKRTTSTPKITLSFFGPIIKVCPRKKPCLLN